MAESTTAAVALERAATLTPDRRIRAGRLIAAGEAAVIAGQADAALGLCEQAALLTADPLELARIARIRGRVASERGQTRKAHEILTAAADSIAGLDPAAAARMLAETILAGRHDDVQTARTFTRLLAITSPGEASAVRVRDAAASAVEIQIRTHEWHKRCPPCARWFVYLSVGAARTGPCGLGDPASRAVLAC